MTTEDIVQRLEALESSGASFDALLERAVELVHESSARFHWTGIYELFPDDVLRLGPFIGAPTDHVFIAVGRGVCGSAIAEKRNRHVPDVTQEPNYLACSDATRSELVILIRDGDRIYGQIDIDSHEMGPFDEADVARVQAVADWLAARYARREAVAAEPNAE